MKSLPGSMGNQVPKQNFLKSSESVLVQIFRICARDILQAKPGQYKNKVGEGLFMLTWLEQPASMDAILRQKLTVSFQMWAHG